MPAHVEPPGVARDYGKRPDGMTLVRWSKGKPFVWNATCVDTLASTAENFKQCKYGFLGQGYIFVTFGVEIIGPWDPEA